MKIRTFWVGRRSANPYEKQIETYRKRVQRRWPAEDIVIKSVAGGRDKDPRRALGREAEAMLQNHQAGWRLVALDERGTQRDSTDFARWLNGFAETGDAGLVFAIGSDLGLDARVLDASCERISLSKMTLPHLLARLVLWEQLFRATSILSGGAYHRGFVQ